MPFYTDWGFAPFFADAIASDEGAPLVPARVVEPGKNEIRIVTEQGTRIAEPSGRIDDGQWPPAAGDWVIALPLDDERALVHRLLPRTNGLARSGGARAQPLAANLDAAFLILALGEPLRLNLVERGLALIRGGSVSPVVILTKADLAEDPEGERQRVLEVAGDAPVLAVSVVTGEGIDAVATLVPCGVTVALLGKSGAGKSSLVNRLAGEELMATGAVREGDHKGRHTTTTRRLLKLPGRGIVVDLPGFRELGLTGDEAQGIEETFDDIVTLASQCRFGDCSHEGEPGCAVTAAVTEGRLDRRRFESYRKLLREAASAHLRADEAKRRAADKRFGKMVKQVMKTKKGKR
ncbi:MAG: ribosome small subunit-dependent GTPase A [Nitrospinae bacterium]|nr:ribosome small subunit-dependent GTPase A [Nitrospinota bacterium]